MVGPGMLSIEDILLQLPCYIYWLDLENRYLGCNDLFAIGSGLTSIVEIIGKRNIDLPANRGDKTLTQEFDNNNRKVIAEAKRQIFQEIGMLRDGRPATFLSYKSPLYNSEHKIVGVIGLSFDISQRVEIENKLRKDKETAEITLEHIIATLPAHVYWKDINGVYLGCNERQAHSLGLASGKEVIGKTDFELPWETEESARIFRENDLEVINTNITRSYEEISTIDGREAIVLSQKVPLNDLEGKKIGVLGISMDITKQKETEKALQAQIEKTQKADDAKSEFLSIMSHEIRGPLANIISLTDVLSNQEIFKDNELNYLLQEMEKEAEEALERIDKVRKYLDLEREGIKSIPSICNIDQLLKKILLQYSDTESVKKYYFINQKLQEEEVSLDVSTLITVLEIVIGNAFRYTVHGKISISADISEKDGKTFILISVSDTGKGMSKNQIENLFNTFIFENSSNITPRYRKPAVSLSMAKKYLNLIGGTLDIESQIEIGTTVILTIPFSKVELKGITKNYKVLLVEDNKKTLLIQKTIFETANCVVKLAMTGNEAIEAVNREVFDLVFLDITLPDISGIDVAKIIHSKYPDLPIIAITSHSSEADIDTLLANRFTDVLAKPLSSTKLKECLSAIEKTYKED